MLGGRTVTLLESLHAPLAGCTVCYAGQQAVFNTTKQRVALTQPIGAIERHGRGASFPPLGRKPTFEIHIHPAGND